MRGNGCLRLALLQLQENIRRSCKVLDQPVIEQAITSENQDGIAVGQLFQFICGTALGGSSKNTLYPLL